VVLFLRAIALDANAAHGAVAAGAGAGALLLIAVVALLLKLGRRMKPGPLLATMGTLLCILAVVLAGKGVRALQEAGVIGIRPLELPRIDWLGIFRASKVSSLSCSSRRLRRHRRRGPARQAGCPDRHVTSRDRRPAAVSSSRAPRPPRPAASCPGLCHRRAVTSVGFIAIIEMRQALAIDRVGRRRDLGESAGRAIELGVDSSRSLGDPVNRARLPVVAAAVARSTDAGDLAIYDERGRPVHPASPTSFPSDSTGVAAALAGRRRMPRSAPAASTSSSSPTHRSAPEPRTVPCASIFPSSNRSTRCSAGRDVGAVSRRRDAILLVLAARGSSARRRSSRARPGDRRPPRRRR